MWPWILLAVALTIVAVLVGLVALGLWLESTPVIDDDMHDGDGPFVAESDPHVDLRYGADGYVMDLTPLPDGNMQYSRSFWSITRSSIDFSISYELTEAPTAAVEYGVGVGCVGAGGTYWLVLSADGTTMIGLDAPEPAVLEQIDLTLPTSGDLRLDCRDGVGSGPTSITGYVDGVPVIEAEHPHGFGSFQAVGILAVIGLDEPYVVTWDDAYAD